AMVKPLRELLERQNQTLIELERKRTADRSGLEEQLKAIAAAHERLGAETGRLVTALRRPEQRGRWGEMQLRNVVELAGMTEHCDFVEQPTTRDEQSVLRPDMIVHMPGGGVIVVDSKVALDAYLDALDSESPREDHLKRHARQVADHVRSLAGRRYWEQFERTPKVVVMFMPLEPALVAALQVNPDLHNDAMQQHVLIATPTLLVALLRAVAYGWQQEDVAANAREIARVGRDLYQRLATFVGNLEKVGSGIQRAANAYNTAIGSLEGRVLPSARALKSLHATTQQDIETPKQLPADVRPIVAAELKPDATELGAPDPAGVMRPAGS
ncbi:MAG: DNA recombination protein RmuC, partial [Planctomycetota bacterium]